MLQVTCKQAEADPPFTTTNLPPWQRRDLTTRNQITKHRFYNRLQPTPVVLSKKRR